MKRRLDDNKDSLDLLLDTMCNAFGGIVLIAILVALLSNEVRISTDVERVRNLSTEMLQRRIAQVERDLEAAQQYRSSLQSQLNGGNISNTTVLLEHRAQLQFEFAALTAGVQRVQSAHTAAQQATAQSTDERARALRTRTAELSRLCTAEQNALASSLQNASRLRERVATLHTEEAKRKKPNVVQLRLPKEHARLKQSAHVIIQYEQLYFVHKFDGEVAQRNTYGLQFDERWNGDTTVTPMRGRGIDLTVAARVLRDVPRQDCYVVCWVYGDSFRVFNQFKQLISNAGYEYGWETMQPEGRLTLTSRQVAQPPPL